MFEQTLEALKEKRAKLNASNSFDEIAQLWNEIKESYSKCEAKLNEVSEKITKFDEKPSTTTKIDLNFSKALKRMEEISETVKTTKIDELPELIQEMQALKNFCFEKLEQESLKMEEIK